MDKYVITKEVLTGIMNFLNFCIKYKEVPQIMAQEIHQLLSAKGSIEPASAPAETVAPAQPEASEKQ